MVSPAPVSKVADLNLQVLIKLRASLFSFLFLDLLLHVLGIKHLLVQIKHPNLRFVTCIGLRTLALLKLLPVELEFVHGHFLLLHFVKVELVSGWEFDACLLEVNLLLYQRFSLHLSQIVILDRFRPHIWTWDVGLLWFTVSFWNLNILP